FLDVIQRVRHSVIDALTHQDLPFEQIIEAIQPERNLLRSPLVQVMFSLQNAPQEEIDFSPLSVSTLEVEQPIAKFDLTLALVQHGQTLEGTFEYNTDLFESDTIARLVDHFQVLLTKVVHTPAQSIESLPLLSSAQYQQFVAEGNTTWQDYQYQHLIFEMIEAQAALHPEAPALSAHGVEMNYGELNRKANQLAHYLQTYGVGPGDLVGIYLPRSFEAIVAFLAILKVGAAYLPMDTTTPAARATFILEDARATLLITQKNLSSGLTVSQIPLLYLEQETERLQAQSIENLPVHITSIYPAYVIYTSGSTGKPKGVLVEHRALLNMMGWYHQACQLTAQDRTVQLASLGFDAAVLEIWPYLAKGATIVLVDEATRLSPTALLPWLVKQQISVCFLTTALAEIIINRQWPAHTALRLLMTGGEQLHHAPPEALPFTLVNGYGPTENTVISTWTPVPPGKGRSMPPIGRAVPNVQLYVLNRAGEPQPIGVPGELYLGGQNLSQGYLHRPDLTAESFVPDPFSSLPGARLYKTGDIVQYLPNGELEFLGRVDHQVKIRGFRIEIGEIESVLLSHVDVREAIVVVNESIPDEKRLAAYVIFRDGAPSSKNDVLRLLREQLPDYMVPASLSILEAFPLTSNGKVDRRALATRRLIRASTPEKYIAPRDTIELQLVHLWEKLLGVSPVSVTDNFFSLGGHSLAGVRLMSQIQRTFGMKLPLSTLFTEATITALANVLRQQEAHEAPTPLVEIQSTGSNTPLFCVHPAGGEVLCYLKLAHYLGSDQPVYGLKAAGLSHLSLEEIATSYREAVRAVQPQGPYLLSGWSMGG
ncbi:MAG TPA: amino acid adenylation domain-containing protein, partial [Ktedonobacteraceae bacterium]|nr:amino acid adenylation domain-containing protein [Ktedonobacteraceae bacterium]